MKGDVKVAQLNSHRKPLPLPELGNKGRDEVNPHHHWGSGWASPKFATMAYYFELKLLKKQPMGTSLVLQWLRSMFPPLAGWIPGQGTKSCLLQGANRKGTAYERETLGRSSLKAGNESPLLKAPSLHLEGEGHPCCQSWEFMQTVLYTQTLLLL